MKEGKKNTKMKYEMEKIQVIRKMNMKKQKIRNRRLKEYTTCN